MARVLARIAFVLLVAGCDGGGTASTASPVATNTVDLPPSYQFVPAAIVVTPRTAVTWTNHDNFTHSVEFLDGPDRTDRLIRPGEGVTLQFADAGTFRYQCSLHPQNMQGSVTVAP